MGIYQLQESEKSAPSAPSSSAAPPVDESGFGDQYTTDRDTQARKRMAIGLSAHRETARETVGRPPTDGNRLPHWLAVACVMLIFVSVTFLIAARVIDPTVTWENLANPFTGLARGAPPTYALNVSGLTLKLNDDFTSNSSLVQEISRPGEYVTQVADQEGVYQMQVWPGYLAWSLFDTTQFAGGRIEATLTVNPSEPSGSAGFIGRYQDSDNFYLFLVNGLGEYTVQVFRDGQLATMQPLTASQWVALAGEPNRLSLDDDGQVLRFYANQTLLFEVLEPQFPAGKSGLVASGGEAAAEVAVDWVALYEAAPNE
jgi:hypothetical protein